MKHETDTLLGPIMGGFIIQHTSWRWSLWTCAIAVSQMLYDQALLANTGPVWCVSCISLLSPRGDLWPGSQSSNHAETI